MNVHARGRGWEAVMSSIVCQQVNGLVEKALTDADLAESDVGSAPRLLEIIMQNCRGGVDACIGSYIALALNRCRSTLLPASALA